MGNRQRAGDGDPVHGGLPRASADRRHTSSPDKAGKDRRELCAATTDVDAVLAACAAVAYMASAYMASGDTRPDEAVNDIERRLRAGVHVVTRRCIRCTTRAPHPRRGSSALPAQPKKAARRYWSAASTRDGPTTLSR